MSVEQVKPLEIFFSYSHVDESLRQALEKHLKSLIFENLITTWHDRDISAGQEWAQQIDQHLDNAHIILLLISADFISSDYCYSIEVKRAMERHYKGEACVIPIILRPTSWQEMPFGKLQCLPSNSNPITIWSNQDEAWVDVINGIRAAVKSFKTLQQGKEAFADPLWMIPYDRNPFFTGREDILAHLRQSFVSIKTDDWIQPQAISGLGGIGKTQIAVEYAYRYQYTYEAVLWINANSYETLVSDFIALALKLQLFEQEEYDFKHIIQAVKHWLYSQGDWLLIFDNVNDLIVVREFLPFRRKGHILITTQSFITGAIAQRIEVKRMDEREGSLFLLQRTKMLDLKAPLASVALSDRLLSSELVQKMEGLPLALDQAGAYMEETGCSLVDYLHLFQTKQDELLRRRGDLATDHPNTVATTLSLSFEKVQQANPAAADILRLCTFLNPDTIPEEIFTKSSSTLLGSHIRRMASDPLLLNDAIRALLTYSLVRHNHDNTLTIHRLTQTVLRHSMSQKTQHLWAERAVRAIQLAFPNVDYTTLQRCQQYLPQVQVCLELTDHWKLSFQEVADLFMNAGKYLTETAQYEQVESFYQHALTIREKIFGLENPDVATTLHSLAELYQEQGKYEQAESFYQRALTIYEKVLGSEHPDTASTLYNIAGLYQEQGKYEQAKSFYQRALKISKQALGTDHYVTVMIQQSYANYRKMNQKRKKAEKMRQENANEQQ